MEHRNFDKMEDPHLGHKNCRRLLDSLSEYIDGELEEMLCAELDRHLEDCEDCRVVVDTLQKTVDLYHVTSVPPDVPDDVRRRLFRRLDLEEYFKG
jgi:anti-sigma factor (TIGR02949 family)